MTNTCYDPQFLQLKAQVQLQAALHLNAAVRNHPRAAQPSSNKSHSSSSSQSPEPKRTAGDQSPRIPLHRNFSDPIPSREVNNFPVPASSSVGSRLPEESSGVNSSLYRSSSDPILPVTASTPPRPPAAGKASPLPPTPSFGEPCGLSPDAKRAKRVQEREQCGLSPDAKDGCGASNGSESEELCDESVWVERKAETRILHFKCHCNKAYKILLSGNDCYYKLNCF